jgi:hypothetical protein
MNYTERELKEAFAEIIKTAGNDPGGKSAFAQTLVKVAEPNHLALNIFSAFMPTIQLQPGDNVQKKVRKGRYPVRTMVPGSMHLTDAVFVADKTAYMFESLIAGTSASLWEIRNGDVDSVARMRRDLRADVTDAIVARVFGLLTSVWNSSDTPNNYTDASSTGLTQTVLDNMVENILETSRGVRAIIGQRRALLPLYDFAGYKPVVVETGVSGTALPLAALQEYFNTNRVTSYKGIPVVELDQIYKNDLPDIRAKMIPTDKVLVVGEDAGSIALMGGFEYQDYTDMRTQPGNYVLHGWQQFGLLVDEVDRLGVLKVA